MTSATTVVVALTILSASVWVGSLVCLAVVTNAARRVLDGASQVVLFQAIGRRYAVVGIASLLVALGAGLELAWPPSSWSAVVDAAVGLAGLLVLATAAGMAQARAMTRLRRRSRQAPGDGGLRRAVAQGRRVATALRAAMALMTLVIVVLAAAAISH